MKTSTKTRKSLAASGFTLVELAIVLLIIGILLLPLIQMYESYQISKKVTLTKENVANAASAMSSIPIRYPCPSDRSLPPTDPQYGIENCVLSTIPDCTTAGLQGICRTVSLRDADGDTVNDDVIIGGVPMKYYENYLSSGLPDPTPDNLKSMPNINSENRLDGWKNQLTYAVSAALMNPLKENSFNDFKNGVISATDENNNPTAGINDNGQFVIVSHGKDESGAFSVSGSSKPCPAGEPETENCDEDSTFTSSIGLYEGVAGTRFDDYTSFYTRSAGDLWYNIVNSGVSSPHITNRNTQNVGVNITTAPAFKLQVGGTLKADSIRTPQICGGTLTSFCLDTSLFGAMPASYGATSYGGGFCGDGQIVKEISGGSIKCGYPAFKAPPNELRKCPSGTYVREVQTNGCIICNNGSKICTP